MEEKELINTNNEDIKSLIYTIRGKQVMLDSDIAIEVSIYIMKAFVEMRSFLKSNEHVLERLTTMECKLLEHDKKFNKEYPTLKIAKTDKFHDRFIILKRRNK